jgi:hypothetical protein
VQERRCTFVHLGVSSFTEIAVTLNFHSLQFFINSLRVNSILNGFWCTSSEFQENKYQNKPCRKVILWRLVVAGLKVIFLSLRPVLRIPNSGWGRAISSSNLNVSPVVSSQFESLYNGLTCGGNPCFFWEIVSQFPYCQPKGCCYFCEIIYADYFIHTSLAFPAF